MSTETLFKTSDLSKYLLRKIIRNSVLCIPPQNEPVFFLAHEIVAYEKTGKNDEFVLLAQRIFDCIFGGHSYTYEVSDFDNFHWKCLSVYRGFKEL